MPQSSNFENNLKELEETVKKLESGEVTLDEAINLFEKGIKLSELCTDKLKEAKQKITYLSDEEEKSNA